MEEQAKYLMQKSKNVSVNGLEFNVTDYRTKMNVLGNGCCHASFAISMQFDEK